jgi:anti-sigma regulatory factor (Ser/Thr protein kinase)
MGALSQDAHQLIGVRAQEDVGAARRAVTRMAAALPGNRAGEAELAATELATNLVRHTTSGGYLLLRPVGGAIELLAVDRGPGMPPGSLPAAVRQPAASRGGGLGIGLPAVRRLSAVFDCYSGSGGTIVLARLHGAAPRFTTSWRSRGRPRRGSRRSSARPKTPCTR